MILLAYVNATEEVLRPMIAVQSSIDGRDSCATRQQNEPVVVRFCHEAHLSRVFIFRVERVVFMMIQMSAPLLHMLDRRAFGIAI
jgi:hypothetical protein